jgi:hypothetical protein
MPLDLRTGLFDKPVVLDAGRTGGDAGHTPEASVEMCCHRIRELAALLESGAHQNDATPRRVHLLAPQHIGRTGRKAEATVHTVLDELEIGGVVEVEGAIGTRLGPHELDPTRKESGSTDPRRIKARLDRLHQPKRAGVGLAPHIAHRPHALRSVLQNCVTSNLAELTSHFV